MKTCTKCKEPREFEFFTIDNHSRDKLNSACKICRNREGREYRENNPEKVVKTIRESNYRRNYGITLEQYEIILKSQNGLCKICEKVNIVGKRLAVDHEHKSGIIRGLLCDNCNLAIGKFEDDVERIKRAVSYLESAGSIIRY